MNRALTIFFGLLALGVLGYVCIGQHREQIQTAVATNASAGLASAGLEFASVSADGQQITLRGTAPSAQARDAAGQVALAADGVVGVDNQIAVETLVPPPGPDPTPVFVPSTPEVVSESLPDVAINESLRVVLNAADRQADVVGRVLTPALAQTRGAEISAAVSSVLPDWQLTSGIETTATVATDLSGVVEQILPALVVAQSATLDADAQGIRIDAKLASFAERTALQARLDAFAGEPMFAERNLSWMLDSPPSPPSPPEPKVDVCQAAFDELLELDSILFTTSKAQIRASSYPLLDKLVGVARDCDGSIAIEGHTDSRGPSEFNDYLSLERARSVRRYLISKGVEAKRISARGFGSNKPKYDNNTVNGRQRNRRIEFRVIRTES